MGGGGGKPKWPSKLSNMARYFSLVNISPCVYMCVCVCVCVYIYMAGSAHGVRQGCTILQCDNETMIETSSCIIMCPVFILIQGSASRN